MKIGYSKTYPIVTNGTWEKIWIEDEFIGTLEEARKHLYALKKEVENFHYESKGHDEKIAAEQKVASLDENGVAIAEILMCKTVQELGTYKYRTTQSKAVQAAYNQKLKQLQNGLEPTSY